MDKVKGERRSAGAAGAPRWLAEVVLVRLATGGAAAKGELARELGALAGARGGRAGVEAAVTELLAGQFIDFEANGVQIAAAGRRRALDWLGGKVLPATGWDNTRDGVLIAKALGGWSVLSGEIKRLTRVDGLAGAIVAAHFDLELKGQPSPSRLRAALALVALERAFGDQVTTDFDAKSGLSAKAGRLLAAQLLAKPRALGTDARLIAALAAEVAGAAKADLPSLRLAMLRRLVEGRPVMPPAVRKKRRSGRSIVTDNKAPKPAVASPIEIAAKQVVPAQTPAVAPSAVAAPAVATRRPDLVRFVTDVRAAALERASGWQGNRKAYISHVWQTIAARRPEWSLTEIEFKAMLAAAHSAGRIVLANADLKDGATLRDVQDSAIAFRNAVFHYVRVDG